jgi:GTPase
MISKSITAAIIGRPNTGKSTLFNRLIAKNKSVIDDLPGVTRDRLCSQVEYYGHLIDLIDTGGYELGDHHISKHILEQVHIAIEESDVVILVVDGKYGLNPLDKEIADLIRKREKKVILAVNKVDNDTRLYDEFHVLGIKDVVAVSSAHSIGLGSLFDKIIELGFEDIKNNDDEKDLDTDNEQDVLKSKIEGKGENEDKGEDKEPEIKIAIAGRPNTGKSTLLNAIAGHKRAVTSHEPGTTRDVVDVKVKNKYGNFTILDTAGIRRYSKTESKIEIYSIMRSKEAVESADVAIWLIDGNEPFTHQDKRVSEIIYEGGVGCLIVVNKKDTMSGKLSSQEIEQKIPYLSYAPLIYVSSMYDKKFDKLFQAVRNIYDERVKKINTGELNRFFQELISFKTPPMHAGKEVKLKYIVQAARSTAGVPRFIIFGVRAKNTHSSYKRYIISKLRKHFGFVGNPVEILFKEG